MTTTPTAQKSSASPRVQKTRQIFGIGGHFYVQPWESKGLMRHLLSLSSSSDPRICLLATATGDNPDHIELFYREMGQQKCRPTHLSLMNPVTVDFEAFFAQMDIIYVGGGATKNLIALWRAWGIDKALRSAWENGVILSGTSAGSICWFESCITDSFPPKLAPLECLGFLKGSASTHYNARPDRPSTFRDLIAQGVIHSPGFASDNDVGLHFINDELYEVVTVRADATAYLVTRTADGYEEQPLPARLIA